MKTKRYVLTRTNTDTMIYRLTVIELVRRGYRFSRAKAMVRDSNIVEDSKLYWGILHDMDEKGWAGYVIEKTSNPIQRSYRYGA